MTKLSPSGQQLVQNLAQRHGVSQDAALHMLTAVSNGNGSMAQFNHSEFGGGGQWMSGGMTMVSDLFNNHLKSRVDNICSDISNELANHQTSPFSGSFQSQSQSGSDNQSQVAGNMGGQNSLFEPDPEQLWWPQELGSPSAQGSQNNARYAYFGFSRRLAVKTGNSVWVYDTGDHQIGGFSQQQGAGGSIQFSSQFGYVDLSRLPVVMKDGLPVAQQQQPVPIPVPVPVPVPDITPNPNENGSSTQPSNPPANNDEIFATLERLGSLAEKGIVTQEEFNQKKTELLNKL